MKNKETEIFAVMQNALWVYVYWTFSYNDAHTLHAKTDAALHGGGAEDEDFDRDIDREIGETAKNTAASPARQNSGNLTLQLIDNETNTVCFAIEIPDDATEKQVMLPSAAKSLQPMSFWLCLCGKVIAKSNTVCAAPEAPTLEDLLLNEKNELLLLSGYDTLIKEEFNASLR